MRNKNIIWTLVCMSLFSFIGCIEENFENITPAERGDEVVFGARAGFESSDPDTKTVYSGATYEANGKLYERIDWVTGATDMIEVYCNEAAAGPNCHYVVNSSSSDHNATTGKDYATLKEMGETSLQWGSSAPHTFYAMYPSERMFDTTDEEGNIITVDMGVEMKNTILTGIVPTFQNPTEIKETANGYEAVPDMRYAYMAAKTTASSNPVNLTFVPLVTAVEIELTLADNPEGQTYKNVYVGEIQVSTPESSTQKYTQPIAGRFTSDLSGWDGVGYPSCTLVEGSGVGQIQITTRKMNKATGIEEPVCLTPGQSLKFTVFLLPTADIKNLVVRYSMDGASAYKSKTLTGSNIPAHIKTRIKQLALPATTKEVVIDASKWMSQLEQTTSLRRLSLPGTGGSFSYNYTTASDKQYYSQQTLDIDQQWSAGIRAFEVIVNRPSNSSTSLGGEFVKCNKKSMNVTFNAVMDKLVEKVRTPLTPGGTDYSECAVVILTYQPEGNSPDRNGEAFAGSLNTWYTSYANKGVLQKYTPDLTIEKAKGSIMVIVRLNQKDEKEGGILGTVQTGVNNYNAAVTTLVDTPFLLVNGCGTAKDRWGARGYKVNETAFPHISNSYSGNNIIETFMESGYLFTTTGNTYTTSYTSGNNTITRAKPNDPEELAFGFETNASDVTCWYQEWARVVDTPYKRNASSGFLGIGGNDACYWFESYQEKLNNATVTFDMAVDNDARWSNHIFINSLCGYLVTDDFSDSYVQSTGTAYGGSGGDIKGLADLITPAFYTHVLNRSKDNTTGPTGIVLMDYVSNNPEDGGACFLPGLIIANNFKYNN